MKHLCSQLQLSPEQLLGTTGTGLFHHHPCLQDLLPCSVHYIFVGGGGFGFLLVCF